MVGTRVRITEGVMAQEVNPALKLSRGWTSMQQGLRVLLREGAAEMAAEERLLFPGLEELISLRSIREVEASGEFDLCVVDCAPTGSTLRMLRLPGALRVLMEVVFDFERRSVNELRP